MSEGASKASLANKATWDSVQAAIHLCFPLLSSDRLQPVAAELVRRDFRRFYVPQSDTLKGRVQGRLNTRQHLEGLDKGRPLEMPCSWEDFTADNWDNRILKAAMHKLTAHGQRHQLPLSNLAAPLLTWYPFAARFSAQSTGQALEPLRAALRLAWLIITGGPHGKMMKSLARPQPATR